MTRIKTVTLSEAAEALWRAVEEQARLYPAGGPGATERARGPRSVGGIH